MEVSNRFFIHFPISEDLRFRSQDLIDEIRSSEDKKSLAMDFVDLVEEIAIVGLDYFFMQPVRTLRLGSLTQGAVSLAINTGRKGVMNVARRIVKGLKDDQLLELCDFVESVMSPIEEDGYSGEDED
jgi:hypothetical protein